MGIIFFRRKLGWLQQMWKPLLIFSRWKENFVETDWNTEKSEGLLVMSER